MTYWKWGAAFAALGAMVGGCGDDGGSSYGDIVAALSEPTGTVDKSTAPRVAEEFEKADGAELGTLGTENGKQNSTVDQACPFGGRASISAESNSSNVTAAITYDACCYEEGCCYDGSAVTYTSTEAGAEHSFCGDWDLTVSCGAESGRLGYEGCIGVDGFAYVIRVDNETFTVTGSYSDGFGDLEISGANGQFSCHYENGAGSCTGDGEFSF